MTNPRSERAAQLAALWERIKQGKGHIAALLAARHPCDRSLAHLEALKAEYLALGSLPLPDDEEPRALADEPPREWGYRRCPICGEDAYGLWLPGSTVYCGSCAIERQRRLASPPTAIGVGCGARKVV